MRTVRATVGLILILPAMASAQALNIDFSGHLRQPPSDSYGAASGQAGYWNTNFTGTLRDLTGTPTDAQITGNFSSAVNDIPNATGGDKALMETVFIMIKSSNSLFILDLEPGSYDLYLYMWGGHFQPPSTNFYRLFNGAEEQTGSVAFSNDWPGGHVQGVTYAHVRFNVLPEFRGFNLTFGTTSEDFLVVNGLQLVPVPAPSAAAAALAFVGVAAAQRRRR